MRMKFTKLLVALAVMLVCGVGVIPGYADEFSDTERLANQGDADAQYHLGEMYYVYVGDGATQDYVKAAYWFGKAAEQGHAKAQGGLGYMYYEGKGVAQDYAKAVYWNEKAANQGYASAQYLLGMMYYNGEGVTQDKQKACRLYRAAADQDIQEALDYYIRDCQ